MSTRNPSNRIEVDLKLLQDENIEKLREFGKQFDKSIGTLATLVGDFSDQVKGARDVVQAGQLGPSASVASNVRLDSIPARMGGISTSGGIGVFSSYGGGGGGSYAPVNQAPGVPDEAAALGFEDAYVKATKRIGEHIPVGPRQTLGYAAEGVIKIPGISQARAARWNDSLFRLAAINANIAWGTNKLQGLYGGIAAPTSVGQQLGRSREGGLFGTGLFSSAWATGMKETLKTGMAADFGLNPNYSMAQAGEARGVLQSLGYSGDTSDRLASMLKELQIHQGMDPGSAMSVMDPFMRFGGPESLGQLSAILQQIPNAAGAARMNLKQFTQELVSTSEQIAQSTGMTVGGAMRGLAAYSAVTGAAPSTAAGAMTDPKNMYFSAGMTHSSLWDVTYGKHAVSDSQMYGEMMWRNLTGHRTPEQLMHLIKTGHSEVMNGVVALYRRDPSIFGGMNPLQKLHAELANNGHVISHERIQESMTAAGTTRQMENLLRAWGGPAGTNMAKQFEIWEAKHPLSQARSAQSHSAAARAFANALLKTQERNRNTRATRLVTIGLTQDAKKLFQIVANDTPQRNSFGATARSAMGTAESVLGDAGRVMGDIMAPAAGAADLFHVLGG